MIIRFLLFFIVTLTVIFFAHLFIYKAHIKFIEIENIKIKRVLILVYIGMFSLLFFSMFAVRFWNNAFTDNLYYISTLWLGILTYLFIFIVLNWIVFTGFKLLNINFNFKYLHLFFLFLTIVVSILGTINYYKIKDTVITVELKNLPSSWEKKKVIFISDIHLGNFREQQFITKFVEKINKKNPDIIIIGGDLFDGTILNVDKISAELGKLHANEKIFFVYGNHDNYSKPEDVKKILKNVNFTILDNASIIQDSVDIIGINHNSLHNDSVFAALKEEGIRTRPVIFISHEPVKKTENLENLGIDLQLSGHTHGGQFFPFTLITKAIYGKMNYGLHDFGKFQSFTSSGLGAWGPAFRLFSKSEIVEIKFKSIK